MMESEVDVYTEVARPNTLTVLLTLLAAAGLFSWLGAYALTNALISAEAIPPWTGQDPRPRWMAILFVSILTGFLVIGSIFRFMSSRQLRHIDAMSDD
jgi:amino acid permease